MDSLKLFNYIKKDIVPLFIDTNQTTAAAQNPGKPMAENLNLNRKDKMMGYTLKSPLKRDFNPHSDSSKFMIQSSTLPDKSTR
jgi:hypothetical protein